MLATVDRARPTRSASALLREPELVDQLAVGARCLDADRGPRAGGSRPGRARAGRGRRAGGSRPGCVRGRPPARPARGARRRPAGSRPASRSRGPAGARRARGCWPSRSRGAASSMRRRGCCGLARIRASGISVDPAPSAGRCGMRAARPRPRPDGRSGRTVHHATRAAVPACRRVADRSAAESCANSSASACIGVGAARLRGVHVDREAVARCLGELHVARDRRSRTRVRARWRAHFAGHLRREVGARVEHRQNHPIDLEVWVEMVTNEVDRREELGQPLERVVLTLDRDQRRHRLPSGH